MTPEQIFFLLAGLFTLTSAIMVVVSPKLVHAALWLIVTLAGIAALFVLLEAGFLAVVQVAIYIDAIAILIIITVMLTRRVMRETDPQVNRNWLLAGVASAVLFAALMAVLSQLPGIQEGAALTVVDQEITLKSLGRGLVDVNQFVLPFEVASILLVAAMIGAIVVSWPFGRSEEGE